MYDAAFYIQHLNLQPHPEGGYYRQTYKAQESISAVALPERFRGDRSFSTAIYYLLNQNNFSAFHKIKSDECWHFYAGDALLIHILHSNKNYECIQLGNAIDKGETLQFVVPANAWFAAELSAKSKFALTGCTVAPGFDFEDFDIADKNKLLRDFPQQSPVIERLCK